jgi:hypothetical protein
VVASGIGGSQGRKAVVFGGHFSLVRDVTMVKPYTYLFEVRTGEISISLVSSVQHDIFASSPVGALLVLQCCAPQTNWPHVVDPAGRVSPSEWIGSAQFRVHTGL